MLATRERPGTHTRAVANDDASTTARMVSGGAESPIGVALQCKITEDLVLDTGAAPHTLPVIMKVGDLHWVRFHLTENSASRSDS